MKALGCFCLFCFLLDYENATKRLEGWFDPHGANSDLEEFN